MPEQARVEREWWYDPRYVAEDFFLVHPFLTLHNFQDTSSTILTLIQL